MKNNKIFKYLDKPLLIMCIMYSFIGVLMVLSASSVKAVILNGVSPYYYFFKQLIIYCIGYLGGLIILTIPTSKYKKFLPLILVGILVSLVLLLIYGKFTNSSRSWFYFGGFGIQPSEFAKLAIIIYLGVFFGEQSKKKGRKYAFLIPIIYSIIVFVLVYEQPDLGTSLIIGIITFLTFLVIPMGNNKAAYITKIGGGVCVVLLFLFMLFGSNILNDSQAKRLNYKNPCDRYTDVTGYQVCNGFIAFNGGGLFGKGIGASTQKYLYLPEAHTDFIFPIFVEELGVLCGIALILGFIFIIYKIFKIASSSFNLRNSIICYGIGIYLLAHLFLNLGGVLALIPLTGVSLPFLSYGGSFNITLIVAMFIVQKINVENKQFKIKNEIKNI
ncbi:MAG: FtsW/RodA/SpoVE family cell cycle protein [Bacilli bacterium]